MREELIKANSLRLGACGVLIFGAAGAGKSALTLALLERAALNRRSAALIGDDYSRIAAQDGALYARNPPHIAGALEIRGAGIFQMAFAAEAALHLAVELKGEGERSPQGHRRFFPELTAGSAQAAPLSLPLLKLPQLGKADMIALCQAIEAVLFKQAYTEPLPFAAG